MALQWALAAHSNALLFMLFLACATAPAAGSSGDASPDFWSCTQACQAVGCGQATSNDRLCSPLCPAGGSSSTAAPRAGLALRLWRWDCAADCRYLCMWQREDAKKRSLAAAAAAGAVEKYHGKWPFERLWGMQEPASVAFSLLNMAAQLRCLACCVRLARRVRRGGRRTGAAAGAVAAAAASNSSISGSSGSSKTATDRAAAAACRRLWLAHFALSANAWLCSSVFHGRDTRLTERLDYYSAGVLVAYNTFLTTTRTLRLSGRASRGALAAVIGAYTLRHLWHMQFVLFDYGLHVKTCIAAGAVQAALWVGWALAAAPHAHRGRAWLLAFVILIHASMAFEVLDFPPLWAALDAHAVWHACTVPLAYVWYRFVAADLEWGAGSEAAKGAD